MRGDTLRPVFLLAAVLGSPGCAVEERDQPPEVTGQVAALETEQDKKCRIDDAKCRADSKAEYDKCLLKYILPREPDPKVSYPDPDYQEMICSDAEVKSQFACDDSFKDCRLKPDPRLAMNEPLGSDEPPPDLEAFPPFFGLPIPVCYDGYCGGTSVTIEDRNVAAAYDPSGGYDPYSNPWSGFDLDSLYSYDS